MIKAWCICINHIEISRLKLLRGPIMKYIGTREQNYSYVTCVSQSKPAYGAIMVHITFFWCSLLCCWHSGFLQNPSQVLELPHQDRCLCKVSSTLQASSLLLHVCCFSSLSLICCHNICSRFRCLNWKLRH